jgi:hypothetical protein
MYAKKEKIEIKINMEEESIFDIKTSNKDFKT